jgi:hypothetical protein
MTLTDLRETVRSWQQHPPSQPLAAYTAERRSWHGEDGTTVEAFRRIGTAHCRAIEIVCGASAGPTGRATVDDDER